MAIYFNQEPVMSAGGNPLAALGFGGGGGGPQIPGVGMNITPMATPPRLAHLDDPAQPGAGRPAERPPIDQQAQLLQMARQFGINVDVPMPRVIVRFPANANDMLLSGVLVGGEALANRAAVVDARWARDTSSCSPRAVLAVETHGSFNLGFNAILNWNDLDAERRRRVRPRRSKRMTRVLALVAACALVIAVPARPLRRRCRPRRGSSFRTCICRDRSRAAGRGGARRVARPRASPIQTRIFRACAAG
jgi:hypothetical protein